MRAVIGIDTAWTTEQPSGVALCVERGGKWRCEAVAPSYNDFIGLADGRAVDWRRPRITGSSPKPERILGAARALAPGSSITAVALDLPLARGPITGRREVDQMVSRTFGAMGCGVHSPSPARPGRISTVVRQGFERQGFHLATVGSEDRPAILEVYPHTALLSLLHAGFRVPYKVSKSGRYWPGKPVSARCARLLEQWRRILAALRKVMSIDFDLPRSFESLAGMKRYEDALDAVVCAWVAIEFLAGRADPLGDGEAAIWTPR